MLSELPVERISEFAECFPGAQAQMMVTSITEGNTLAQFWASPSFAGDILLLWDKGNIVFYLATGAEAGAKADEVADMLAALLTKTIWPQAVKEGLHYFSISARSSHQERMLMSVFRGISLYPIKKRFYAFRQPHTNSVPVPDLADVEFLPIDADLLNRTDLVNVHQVDEEVRWMWSDIDRFFQRGFGVAARRENQIICWCTAEYMSRAWCGIGIETAEEFQGKGVATATAASFVAESLRRNIRPHWECDASNPASARVAEKVGFTLVQGSAFLAGRFPHK